MEKVYGCGQLDYTSEPLCLREFFNDASLQHHPFVEGSQSRKEQAVYRETMMDVMDSTLTDSEFQDLENICRYTFASHSFLFELSEINIKTTFRNHFTLLIS